MRECDGRRENEREKKVSVRIEKGRKGGKNRVGNRQARDKEKRDRSGHVLSRKGQNLGIRDKLGQCMFAKLCYFLYYNVLFSKHMYVHHVINALYRRIRGQVQPHDRSSAVREISREAGRDFTLSFDLQM